MRCNRCTNFFEKDRAFLRFHPWDSQIEFTSRIPATLPSISIDPMKIKQVLLNLLKNAKDAVLSCPDNYYI